MGESSDGGKPMAALPKQTNRINDLPELFYFVSPHRDLKHILILHPLLHSKMFYQDMMRRFLMSTHGARS
ncbi:hypothetical protein M5689_000856 [Euphorbia peplus]|nr:hypothetical protein M5689_000856 [Euphorbia peplus]